MNKADTLIRRKATPSDLDSVKSRRKALNSRKKDPELLRHCESLWLNLADFREQRKRGNRFYDGDQWGDTIVVNGETMTYREYLRRTGNFVFQTNQIKNRVDTIAGLREKSRTEPVCEAVDTEEQPYGELVTVGVQTNSDKNQFVELEQKWIKDACNGGLASAYESYDDSTSPERRLDSWTQYINPNRLFFDVDGTDPRCWDISTIGVVRYATREKMCAMFVKKPSDYTVLEQLYPNQFAIFKTDRTGSVEDKFSNESLVFMDTTDPERCFYCEVWTNESKARIRLHDLNTGTEEIIDADDKEYRAEIKAENERRKQLAIQAGWSEEDTPYIIGDGYGRNEEEKNGFFVDTFYYCRYLAPDGTILWEGESPYANRMHPFTLFVFSYIDGRIIGYNHDAIDHNIAINRQWVLGEWLKRAQAKGVVVVPKKIVPDDISYKDFARSWTAIDEMVFIDPKPGFENMMPKVFYGNAQNVDVSREISLLKDLMDSSSPINGALQGKDPGRATSGTLYAQMVNNASTSVAAFLAQFSNFIRQALIKKMKNIAMFYDEERWRKIAGNIDSLTDFSTVNLNKVGDVDLDLKLMESSNSLEAREYQEQDLENLLFNNFIDGDEYTKLSKKPYIKKLRQMREARQAEMEDMQQAGMPMPMAGAPPEAVPAAQQQPI